MTRSRFLRLLRIAVSAVFGILCLLVIAFWVRSQRYVDIVGGPISAHYSLEVGSLPGVFGISVWRQDDIGSSWQYEGSTTDQWSKFFEGVYSPRLWSAFDHIEEIGLVTVPDWFLILVTAILGILPWKRQVQPRFGLRTLLLVTTLVAVVLGLVVATR